MIYQLYPKEFFERADFEETMKIYHDYQILIVEEDRSMMESLQRAMASRGYVPGRMSTLETPIHNYLKGHMDRIFSRTAVRRKVTRLMTDPSNIPELARAADILVRDYLAVRSNENVLITTDTATDMFAVQAVLGCVETIRAKGAVITIPQLPFQGTLADPYIPDTVSGAVMRCDVWIDLTFPYFAGATLHDEAMKTGRVRYLLGGDMGSGGIARLFGKVDLDRYFEVQHRFDALIAGLKGDNVGLRTGTAPTFPSSSASRVTRSLARQISQACILFPERAQFSGERVGARDDRGRFGLPRVLHIDARATHPADRR